MVKFEFEKAQRNQSKYLLKGRREEQQAETERCKAKPSNRLARNQSANGIEKCGFEIINCMQYPECVEVKSELESDLAAIGETRNAKLSTERNNYGKERAEWGSKSRNRRVNSPSRLQQV